MLKTALVTGGSRGIGKSLVKKLCDSGYTVAFLYINSKDKAEEIANKYNIVTINGHSGQFPSDWSNKMSPYHGDDAYAKSIDEWISKYNLTNVYAYDINTNIWIKY